MSKLVTMDEMINDNEYIMKCVNYLKSLPKLYSCKDDKVRKYSEYFNYFKDCFQDSKSRSSISSNLDKLNILDNLENLNSRDRLSILDNLELEDKLELELENKLELELKDKLELELEDNKYVLDKEYILNKFCYDILDSSSYGSSASASVSASDSSSASDQSDTEYYIINEYKKTKKEKEKLKKLIRIVHFQKFAYFLKEHYDFDIDEDVKLWYPASFNKAKLEDFIIQPLNRITYTLKKTIKDIIWYDTYYCNAFIDFDDIFSDKFSTLLRCKMLNLNDDELDDFYINDGCLK